jgi:serine/threonine-protein kinase haspin
MHPADTFGVSQLYAIIVLPNGGPDLEAYKFTNGKQNGWRQACSLFWQVARALARAEQLVSFEVHSFSNKHTVTHWLFIQHRDLHWGQILVRNIPSEISPLKVRKTTPPGKKAKLITMDQLAYGVRATIIDLGLSRMDAADGAGGEQVHWTPLADEIFMGEGLFLM